MARGHSAAPRERRRFGAGLRFEQHGAARIEIGPLACFDQRVEIRRQPIRREQDARQRARVLVDVAVARVRQKAQIARLEVRIDLADMHARDDVTQAQHVGEQRAIGWEQRAEHALVRAGDVVARAGRVRDIEQDAADCSRACDRSRGSSARSAIRSRRRQFDAVAPVRGKRLAEQPLQQQDRFILGVRLQHVEALLAAAPSTRSARC